MLKKLAAVGFVAGALVIAAPIAASANDSYVTPPDVTVGDAVVDVCNVSTVTFSPGFFRAGEEVNVSVDGANAAAASVSGTVADADGSLALTFQPPADGNGNYTIGFTGADRSYSSVIAVSDGKGVGASCGDDPAVASGDGGLELALTGADVSPWLITGGAVTVIAGSALLAASIRRKNA